MESLGSLKIEKDIDETITENLSPDKIKIEDLDFIKEEEYEGEMVVVGQESVDVQEVKFFNYSKLSLQITCKLSLKKLLSIFSDMLTYSDMKKNLQ